MSTYRSCARKLRRRLKTIALLLLLPLPGLAYAGELRLPQLLFVVRQPGATANALAQTPDGYVWFGTERGLVRTDGVRETLYDGGVTSGLPSGPVTRLLVDRRGVLWVGTQHEGLRFLGADGAFRSALEGPKKGAVTDLLQARSGDLWVGTRHGLFRQSQGKWSQFGVTHGLPSDHVTALLADNDGGVWVETPQGRAHWTGQAFEAAGLGHGAARLPPMPLRLEALGEAVSASSAWNAYRGTFVPAALVDRAGEIWMARPAAAGLLHVMQQRRTTYTVRDGLGSNSITSLLEDREGGIWAAGHSGGVTLVRRRRFATLTAAHGLPGNVVSAVVSNRQGAVWVVGAGGLGRIEHGQITAWPVGKTLPAAPRFLAAETSGAVWVAGLDTQLVRFDGQHFLQNRVPASRATLAPSSLFVDRDNVVWVAFVDGSVFVLQDGVIRYARAPLRGCEAATAKDPCPGAITAMLSRAEGGLWMVSPRGGVWSVANGSWTKRSLPREALTASVFSAFEDRMGVLWLCTHLGLVALDGQRSHRLDVSAGLPSNHMFSALQDAAGAFWLTSNVGVMRLRSGQIADVFADAKTHLQPTVFGLDDGLSSEPIFRYGGPVAARGEDGRLYFASTKGLMVFEAPENWSAFEPLKVQIEQVILNGNVVAPVGDGVLHARAGSADLRLQFSAPTFDEPQRVRFRHRLRPSQQAYTLAVGRSVHYAALSAGNHIFELEVTRTDEPERVSRKRLMISVTAPFYQSPWFYAMCALGGVVSLSVVQGRIGRKTAPPPKRPEDAGVATRLASMVQATLDLFPQAKTAVFTSGTPFAIPALVHDTVVTFVGAAARQAIDCAHARHFGVELCYATHRLEVWIRHDRQIESEFVSQLKVRAEQAQATLWFYTDPGVGSEIGLVFATTSKGLVQ